MSFELSDSIKLVLSDGDEIWPTTMSGSYRLVVSKTDHNILGQGEREVSEKEMIQGVLNDGLPSRWRSKSNPKRNVPNHFSINSPFVTEVHLNVAGVWVRFR